MSKVPPSNDDDDVGYKRPPKKHQWKKGQSGNPSGKKSKQETLHDTLKRLAGQDVLVQKNGVQMSMSQGEAMLTAVFARAMQGDIACARFIAKELGISVPSASNAAEAFVVTEDDLACLKTHADWVAIVEEANADLEASDGELNDADDTE